jgi:hypothetical protein
VRDVCVYVHAHTVHPRDTAAAWQWAKDQHDRRITGHRLDIRRQRMATAELQEETAIERVREQLHRRYDRTVVPGEVDRALEGARHRFDSSPIRTFVPILVERQVRDELNQRLHTPSA